ncbi:MAG TPA: CheR family methyltransferase [Stellaceae bacterium]|nr:CheR family methyltransferase [Stellaceae bacterium]
MTASRKRRSAERPPLDSRSALVPVVGIGGSAGAVPALKAFFSSAPADSGLSFVVVQHLDPDHRTALPELLGHATAMPARLIEDGGAAQPNHIHILPPNATLTIKDGRLRLEPPALPRGQRTPIDDFLTSLAADRGENAACVILSGTGSDGTLGLRAIKESGGLTLAQAGAEYDGMMRSAVSTGLVDFVLPAEEMAAKLVDYFSPLHAEARRKKRDGLSQDTAAYLGPLCAVLRARTGHDFSGYKYKTIIRRVLRRMQVLKIDEMPAYLERLRADVREVDLLFQDLLIGVTNFFRDPAVFAALEHDIVPRLFEGRGADDAIRVWVPGCATGEEAYSIAILLRERMPRSHAGPKLQIFATDIDEQALEIARAGRYPAAIAKDVPGPLLERYFLREDGTYRVASELREVCLFSAHNLLRDAPFSKLDLISCRNLLIYLGADLQSRLVPLFLYALRDSGYLLLGTSENVARHSRLFATADKAHHIFQRRPQADRRLPEFPLTSPNPARRKPAPAARPAASTSDLQSLADRQLLERYAPACVVINEEGELLHVSGRTGKYLELPPGLPSNNIFGLARRGLRLELRAALHRAARTGESVTQRNLAVGTNGGRQTLDIIVQPLRRGEPAETLYMVVFRDVGEAKSASVARAGEPSEDAEDSNLRALETELAATKERLQTATEELESSNEELKSGNEELSSINEELQSANEELETSKEELQSINEELQTVNAELKMRVEELSRANSDIANLLASTQIAAVFLDHRLAIKSFTPAAKEVFRLVESDVGRPISHVRSRLRLDTVEGEAERVLRTLGTIEKQVESADTDARFIMRMMPYRTVDNVIAGVVITFIDVTRITAAEARINTLTRDLRDRLETLLDLLPVGIFITEDSAARRIRVNRYGARLLGEEDEREGPRAVSALGRLIVDGRELPVEERPLQRAARTGKTPAAVEGRLLRADGGAVEVMILATPLFDGGGQPRGAIAAIIDISERKRAEAARERLMHELQHRVKNILATVASLASRMLKDHPSIEDFSAAFLARIMAMGRMHELLSTHEWEGVDIRALTATALAPYVNGEENNTMLSGPAVRLGPNAAETFGMALHELATNAAKYGALSVPDGRVEVVWQVQNSGDGKRLALTWTERGGPPIGHGRREGFGTGFVRRSVEYELEGRVSLSFEPSGFRSTIEFPLREGGAPPAGGSGDGGDAR